MSRYKDVIDGNWMLIKAKGRTACCDCGLVHDEEFRVTKDGLLFKAVRNRRATAQVRRHMNVKLIPRRGSE